MHKLASTGWATWGLCVLGIALCTSASAHELHGTVVDAAGKPIPGALIYGIGAGAPLVVENNQIMDSTGICRAMSDRDGHFALDIGYNVMQAVFAIDMEDRVAAVPVPDGSKPVTITIAAPAEIRGRYLHGPNPVSGQEFHVFWATPSRYLRYSCTARTGSDGSFSIPGLPPGNYLVEAREEVPQVGCCFHSVAIAHKELSLKAGKTASFQVGGTKLPYLHGHVVDSAGGPLHGVWVSLWQEGHSKVWSTVTRRDGTYAVYDLPAGDYKLRCFRRLVENRATDVLDTIQPVSIHATAPVNAKLGLVENTHDVTINLQPFMPLEEGQQAPPIKGTLLDGTPFDSATAHGKVMVVYFYASWCAACAQNAPHLNDIAAEFQNDPVVVLAVDLDKSKADCLAFTKDKFLVFPQIFDGPWNNSVIGKAYHISTVPTSFVIGRDGKIAYMDVFGKYMTEAIRQALK